MANFFDTVLAVLKQDDRFFAKDGAFLRNAVYEAAMKMDTSLLRLLLNNEETSKRFFADVDGVKVFDKVGFGWVVNNRQFLPDSYTRFKNKIGLADSKGDLISESGDVELVFPYKDCVLEGGQTKEDQKRSEIFYNETLALDEVDRLLYPKVFTNAVRYTADGQVKATEFTENDNLLIKGNNLIALSSLLKRYAGKVKLIYIDPPYYFANKKDEDTFEYNSNFKFSSWLVFMKNRLELAKRLLSNDGAIFVQISDDGVAELHRLMKDVFNTFNENNFINKIIVKTKSPSGFASVNPGVFETAEYILGFAKHKKNWTYNPQFVQSDYDSNYKWYIKNIEDDCEKWEIEDIFEYVAKKNGYSSKRAAIDDLGSSIFEAIVGKFALSNANSVYQSTAIGDKAGQEVVRVRELSKKSPNKVFAVERANHYKVYIKNGREVALYSRKIKEIDGITVPSVQLTNIWIDTPYEGIANEGGVTLKGGKKPEKLIRRIIEMSTKPGDLFMDFHLGSGTSCAVAHKLGRHYIGIEQLQPQVEKILIRMPNVVRGEQTGISKTVNWKGGGSFVYCELAKLNQTFIDEIQQADTEDHLLSLFDRIINTGYISHKVNPADIDTNCAEYQALSFDNKKRFLAELLDKNLLYVNYCDMDDEEYAISEEDKAFTRSFYEMR